MTGSLHNDYGAIWEQRLVKLFDLTLVFRESACLDKVLSGHTSVDEETWTSEGTQTAIVIEANHFFEVRNNSFQVDRPLNCLVVLLVVVHDVTGNEIGDAFVYELVLDNANGLLTRAPFNIKTLYFFKVVQGLFDYFRVILETYWRSVETNNR